ncbi:MAG: sulfate reduction electron transfer complex DsrMKJOP subunit DsrJ [Polyangiaceae bacterium]|nr:sulfate reduction electron transfer complex DsrMKJOP subunit DsrJ [Polyangiaceae bacterium]
MRDSHAIAIGSLFFIGLFSSPFWHNLDFHQSESRNDAPVKLEPPPNQSRYCVATTENAYMRTNHMRILSDWRNDTVRDNNRTTFVLDGISYERSLSKTCLNCHSNKDKFCDNCHAKTGVQPKCWNCHIAP